MLQDFVAVISGKYQQKNKKTNHKQKQKQKGKKTIQKLMKYDEK